MSSKTAIVIGAGIIGLATARALALKGFTVTVIERNEKAIGASIRNFGMLWLIGQPDGMLYSRALRSKTIWKEIATSIGLWYNESGSLHVANLQDEWIVLQELYEAFNKSGRPVQLLSKEEILTQFKGIKEENLLGGLFSNTEMIIDPRDALAGIPLYLETELKVKFIWNKTVTWTETGSAWIGKNKIEADVICICSGADFETLYPAEFIKLNFTKCKLQMMRFKTSEKDCIGTSLCGGLSLIHYESFKVAPSLQKLKERYQQQMPDYLNEGIHVMVSENDKGELTVGDSHQYGLTFDPFDKAYINKLIMDYLQQFAVADNWELIETWNGIYAKLLNGNTEVFLQPDKDVYIVNGLRGAGMTLSFGFTEEVIATI